MRAGCVPSSKCWCRRARRCSGFQTEFPFLAHRAKPRHNGFHMHNAEAPARTSGNHPKVVQHFLSNVCVRESRGLMRSGSFRMLLESLRLFFDFVFGL